jgi:molybdopterin molybdotransferase
MGGVAEILPVAKDEADALRMLALEGAQADLFITLGGASVGDHDLIRPALTGHGLELDLYKVAMRPGKPLMAGRLAGTPMIGLPGNPVSAMVCGRVFMAPALAVLSGMKAEPLRMVEAELTVDIGPNGPREHYMRARCERVDGVLRCSPFESQDSSRLALLSRSNALMVRSVSEASRGAGDAVSVILLEQV